MKLTLVALVDKNWSAYNQPKYRAYVFGDRYLAWHDTVPWLGPSIKF